MSEKKKKCEACGQVIHEVPAAPHKRKKLNIFSDKRRKELVGIQEIASMANVVPSAVVNWRTRFTNFPPPVAELASGPVFQKADIQLWLKKKNLKPKGLTWDEMCELEAKHSATIGNRFG